jgi:small subunit ribosomal protein S3
MGQKVNPVGFRLGIVKDHTSVWYADKKNYPRYLLDDLDVRDYLRRRLAQASVSRIEIERPAQTARITIHTARPGIVIGKKGEDVERLRVDLARRMGVPVHVNIEEIRKPELDALLVAQNVAQQLERRVQFRRAMRRVIQNAMRLGAEGIKVRVAGRLGGAEIARSEVYHEGRVPLHTLRADIDYATWEAKTTYGVIGIKVWIFKGEVIGRERGGQQAPA